MSLKSLLKFFNAIGKEEICLIEHGLPAFPGKVYGQLIIGVGGI